MEEELDEIIKEVESLWYSGFIPQRKAEKILHNYTRIKTYYYGPYGDVELRVYKKGNKKLYVVVYTPTMATKIITPEWNEAENIARMLSSREKYLRRLFE